MKFSTTAAIAACLAYANGLRVNSSMSERLQLWEVCESTSECATGYTCSPYKEGVETRICKYAQRGE